MTYPTQESNSNEPKNAEKRDERNKSGQLGAPEKGPSSNEKK